ncbi:MAG: NUDIX hydrolase [Isosphaeraceae bacterium]
MPGPYCYEYPRPAVTVDLVVFSDSGAMLRILLIRRKHEPFTGKWALPGGFLDLDETAEHAARRELQEETGVELSTPISFLGVYDDPARDPRGRTISIVFVTRLTGKPPAAQGGDDAQDATWLELAEVSDLAFDHDRILSDARAWLERQATRLD